MRWIEITTKIGCSAQCAYCPQTSLVRNYLKRSDIIYLTLDMFKECLSTVPTTTEVHFTGYCEPFENPNIVDFIEHALDKGHPILINTTLKKMKKEYIDRLVKIKEDGKWGGPITVHAPCIEYKSNIVSDKYYEMLRYLIEQYKTVRIHAHGTPVKEVEDIIKSYGEPYFIKRRGLHSRSGNVDSNLKDASKLPKKFGCERMYDNVLLPNGDVALCCTDYSLEEIIGNLTRMSYQELHLTEHFKNVIEKGKSPLCAKCEF